MEVGYGVMDKREIPRREGRQERQVYWWIKAIVDGRLYCTGPWPTEEEAMQAGYRTLDVNYEVIKLHTKNSGEATRQIKLLYLEETRDVRESTRNASHIVRGER